MSPRPLLPIILSSISLLGGMASAGPLQRAQVETIINDVRLVDSGKTRPAKTGDVVNDDIAVRTGEKSRAELIFQDKTLTRVGPNSLFSFKAGTRKLSLDQGTLLLQVPKGLGGAEIRTAAVTAAITGTTILVENAPNAHFKVLVLEGSLRLSMNRKFGGAVTLTPGKMALVGAKDLRLSPPVTVDLSRLVKTSSLINPDKFRGTSKKKVKTLPSTGLIEREISVQEADKAAARLISTNQVIQGTGTETTNGSQPAAVTQNSASGNRASVTQNRTSSVNAVDVVSQRTEVAKAAAKSRDGSAATLALANAGLKKAEEVRANNGKGKSAENISDGNKGNGKGNAGNTGNHGNGNGNSGNNGNQGNGKGNSGNNGKGKGANR